MDVVKPNGDVFLVKQFCLCGLFTFTLSHSDFDPDSNPIPVVDSKNSVQCEKFNIVQCSHLVCSPIRQSVFFSKWRDFNLIGSIR